MGCVTAGVAAVVPIDDAMELLPLDPPVAVAAFVAAPGPFGGEPDPVTPLDVAVLVELATGELVVGAPELMTDDSVNVGAV